MRASLPRPEIIRDDVGEGIRVGEAALDLSLRGGVLGTVNVFSRLARGDGGRDVWAAFRNVSVPPRGEDGGPSCDEANLLCCALGEAGASTDSART